MITGEYAMNDPVPIQLEKSETCVVVHGIRRFDHITHEFRFQGIYLACDGDTQKYGIRSWS